jgi:tetratricopeptide (TPR) repeat protein
MTAKIEFAREFHSLLTAAGLSSNVLARQLADRQIQEKDTHVDGIEKTSIQAFRNGKRRPQGDTLSFIFKHLKENPLVSAEQLEKVRTCFRAALEEEAAARLVPTVQERSPSMHLEASTVTGIADLRDMIRPYSDTPIASYRVRETLNRLEPPNSDFESAVFAVAGRRHEEARSIADKGLQERSMSSEQALWIKAVADFHEGDYHKARQGLEEIYKLSPGSVANLEDLAMLRFYDKDLEGAAELFERVVEKRSAESLFQVKTAEALSNLAMSLVGQDSRAELLLWQSLAAYAIAQRRASIEQVGIVSNLASLAFGKGDPARARKLFEKTIDMHDQLPQEARDMVTLATLRNNFGMCLLRQGENSNAKAQFYEALKVREIHLPKDHPDIAESLIHVAHVEKPNVSEGMYRRAITILEAKFGKNDIHVGMAYLSLAVSLESLGRGQEANEYFGIVKKLCEGLSPEHELSKEYLRVGLAR